MTNSTGRFSFVEIKPHKYLISRNALTAGSLSEGDPKNSSLIGRCIDRPTCV